MNLTDTHYIGIKYHGAKYIKHFLGPVWWMIPIILPIELIGHVARILSLSFRLFGNMMGHELVLAILFGLAGLFFAPLPIMALGIFVALQSTRGQAIREFILDSRTEVRKVVWPSRQETVQTTLIVFAVVVVMAIFLWLVDLVLLEIVKVVTGQGG